MGKVIETVADSIAIEILNGNSIITGKGNELHLFTSAASEGSVFLEQVLATKLNNKVHGIRKSSANNDGILLVYGEKEFVLLTYSCDEHIFEEFYRAHLSDWISCGSFIDDSAQLVLCTAHSIILRFDYSVSERSCVLTERSSCTDKSTLYCARLHGSTWSDLVVFGGNAFGELLVWQPSQSNANVENAAKPKISPLMHRISAHNGVIFSIDYDCESQQLITTSDDRAVKWWQVKYSKDSSSWNDCSFNAVASGYGHVARVFQGRIIKDGPHIYTLSVGEDSYFCLWRCNGELLFKRRQHYGSTIWNFAYDNSNKTIYTTGSDGNLIAYGLNKILQEVQGSQKPLLLPQVNRENSNEYVAKIKFLNDYTVLGITNQNRLLSISKLDELNNDIENGQWQCIDIAIDFKCTVLEVYGDHIAICGFKRMLLLKWNKDSYTFEKLRDAQILEGVIRTFVYFDHDSYLVCDDKGNCQLSSHLWKERILTLPKCKEPWLTTALLLNVNRNIVISNRQGNLLLYKLSNDELYYELKDTIKHPHGNLGATQLQLLENKENGALVRSSGHDGAINVFFVDFSRSTVKFCSREIIAVSWVETIEAANVRKQDLFLGFNDNHFVAWCKDYEFLIQLSCGGGHRCWHFAINHKKNQISLVFIKNKRIRFYRLPLLNTELISLSPAKRWHIAPCNVMSVLTDDTDSFPLAVTAGDDNLIKIHTISNGILLQKKELHQHISNVRALQVIALNSQECLIFSGGGRAQLCITKINKTAFHVEELLNYTLKQITEKKSTINMNYNFDPETRLMSLDVKVLADNEYHVYIGCSDGFIRVVGINLNTLAVQQLYQYFYNKCVLQIKYITDCNYVLAAATDGVVRIFDSTLEKCLHQLPHHSSGINGLSICYESDVKSLKILTGGDDQAVSYTELSLGSFSTLNTFHKPYLHTAQVCAAAISADGRYGYTSGVDQNLHKLDLSTGDVVDSFHSCVADIKGVSLAANDVCLLYGCGLQSYAFNR